MYHLIGHHRPCHIPAGGRLNEASPGSWRGAADSNYLSPDLAQERNFICLAGFPSYLLDSKGNRPRKTGSSLKFLKYLWLHTLCFAFSFSLFPSLSSVFQESTFLTSRMLPTPHSFSSCLCHGAFLSPVFLFWSSY